MLVWHMALAHQVHTRARTHTRTGTRARANTHTVNKMSVGQLGKAAPQLRSLSVASCGRVGDDGVIAIAEHCTSLQAKPKTHWATDPINNQFPIADENRWGMAYIVMAQADERRRGMAYIVMAPSR